MTLPQIRWKGDLWAVGSALTTGAGLVIAKILLGSIDSISLNAQIFFVGAIIILIDAAVSGNIEETVRVRPRQLLFLLMISIIFCGAVILLYAALGLSEPATVSFLSRLELIATLFFASMLLKERVSLAEMAGLVIVIAGIFVMRYKASVELSRAVLFVAASSVLFGAGEVLIKSRINWISHRAFIFYRNIMMSAIFLIISNSLGVFKTVSGPDQLGLLILAGFFLPYMGRKCYLKAMHNINVSRASIIVQSQPFFAAAAALLVLGTFPPAREVFGGMLIVAGVVTIKLIEMRIKKAGRSTGLETDNLSQVNE